jgi:sigma-B regulation protein RsbU (phosphoserine phosphatase)
VAIGDVSGHCISSALLLATVRSSLRQRASLLGSIAKTITDVNRQLVQDVEDPRQFLTMFFLSLEPAIRQLEWVRAGHDVGIVYNPVSDSFCELGRSGIALLLVWMTHGSTRITRKLNMSGISVCSLNKYTNLNRFKRFD